MCRQLLLFLFHSYNSLLFILFVSFCFISFIFFFFFFFFLFFCFFFFLICFSYLLRTGLFHCELHNTSGLIVEKVLTLLLQFWRQMVIQRLGESNQML